MLKVNIRICIYMKFILPFPPSVNAAYKMNRGKRSKGAKVIAWEKKASDALNQQNILPYVGRCVIIYELCHPDNRTRDAANYEKSTTDFLVAKGILPGDDRRHIKGILSIWNDIKGDFITIHIRPASHPIALP